MKISLKRNPDLRIEERLSSYVGEQSQINVRLAQVARPPQMDPKISLRLFRCTR